MNKDFSKTMLIIGAGAHVPYGYPTAQGLTDLIKALKKDCNKVVSTAANHTNRKNISELESNKVKFCQQLVRKNLVEKPKTGASNAYDILVGDLLENFLTEFGQSQVYSIDSYLANYMKRPKDNLDERFPIIGKMLIAYFLKDYEDKTPVGFHKFDWIQHIINKHLLEKKSFEAFFKKPPKIFTFNYDNHLEKSLYFHLKSYHGISNEEAKRKIDSLGIKHIYGHIDSLNLNSIDDIVDNAIKNLLVMGEERSRDDLLQLSKDISQAMHKSEHVYFLGFGFDDLNTKLLFQYFDSTIKNRQPEFYSTNVGLTKYDLTQIYEKIPVSLTIEFSNDEVVDSLNLIGNKIPIFPDISSKSTTDIMAEMLSDYF